MRQTFEEQIASCALFAGCGGPEMLPPCWRGIDGRLEKLVVFGYGSIVWKPGIEFQESHVGYINGFVRRMWQGNETHRGRKGRPGRVATLIPRRNKRTYGKAFFLETRMQIADAMEHLVMREISLGGYRLGFTEFFPYSSTASPTFSTTPTATGVPALVFSATGDNEFYLGPSKMSSMARGVATACGPSGHNVEYLVKICDFMRNELAGVDDNHLFRLEKLTLRLLGEKGIDYRSLAYPELFSEGDSYGETTHDAINLRGAKITTTTTTNLNKRDTEDIGDVGDNKTPGGETSQKLIRQKSLSSSSFSSSRKIARRSVFAREQ